MFPNHGQRRHDERGRVRLLGACIGLVMLLMLLVVTHRLGHSSRKHAPQLEQGCSELVEHIDGRLAGCW